MMTALPPPATTSAAVSRPIPLLPPTTISLWPAKFAVMSDSFLLAVYGSSLPLPLCRTSSGHVLMDELSWLRGIPGAFADAGGYPGTRAGQRPSSPPPRQARRPDGAVRHDDGFLAAYPRRLPQPGSSAQSGAAWRR